MDRDHFTFFRSYIDAVEILPARQQLEALKALIHYSLDETEPANASTAVAVILALAKPTIDRKRRGAPEGNRNNPHGRRGKTDPEEEPEEPKEPKEPNGTKSNQFENQMEPNGTNSEINSNGGNQINQFSKNRSGRGNMDDGEGEKDDGEGEREEERVSAEPANTPAPSRPPDKKFHFDRLPPDPAEIAEYAKLHGIPSKVASKFYAHYYGNGWTVNGVPMANWGAKLTEWAIGGMR